MIIDILGDKRGEKEVSYNVNILMFKSIKW